MSVSADDPAALVRLAELIAERVATGRARAVLVDAREAAGQLGVPPSWLLTEARRNRVPHVRIGKYVRFDPAALERWAQGKTHGPRSRDAPGA